MNRSFFCACIINSIKRHIVFKCCLQVQNVHTFAWNFCSYDSFVFTIRMLIECQCHGISASTQYSPGISDSYAKWLLWISLLWHFSKILRKKIVWKKMRGFIWKFNSPFSVIKWLILLYAQFIRKVLIPKNWLENTRKKSARNKNVAVYQLRRLDVFFAEWFCQNLCDSNEIAARCLFIYPIFYPSFRRILNSMSTKWSS